MNLWQKGVLVGVLQCLLVSTVAAKFLYDRRTRPRVWVKAAPYDPNLPLRGRYVSLTLLVDACGLGFSGYQVALEVSNNRLAVRPGGAMSAYWDEGRGCSEARLSPPVLFFIPDTAQDPSRRPVGEELWVEVTVPRKGPPRPIRLGIKKAGALTPLDIR